MARGFKACPGCGGSGCSRCKGSGLVSRPAERKLRPVSPGKAALLNLIPVPIGIGWIYLNRGGQVLLSVLVRVGGIILSIIGVAIVGLFKCFDNTDCNVNGEAAAILIGVSTTILLLSAAHAHAVASDMNKKLAAAETSRHKW